MENFNKDKEVKDAEYEELNKESSQDINQEKIEKNLDTYEKLEKNTVVENINKFEEQKQVVMNNTFPEVNQQPINNNFNNNREYEDKNHSDIRKLTILILVLFVVCILGILLTMNKNNSNDKKENEKSNATSKVNADLKYTEVSSSNEGTYIIDVSDVVENVMPSIVAITSKTLVSSGNYGPFYHGGNNQYATGAGSGIIVSKTDDELMILTNKHVIEDAEQLSVKFINDKNVDATVKGYSSSKDIAIISIKLSSLDSDTLNSIKIATIGDSSKLKVGQGVIAIGNALGYGQSVTTGVISALNREVTIDNITTNMIQTDAAINGGNSGGALLNSKGEVIGINSAKYSSSATTSSASIEGMGFAIPISDVSELIKNLMNGTNLSDEERGYLGVSGYIIDESYSEVYSMPKGFYISSIVSNSGVDKANLSIGNIITEIDGKEVKQFTTISEVLETKKAGDKVTLKVKYIDGREYKEKEVTITLSSYKEVNS